LSGERPTWRCEEIAPDVLHVSIPRRRGFVNVQLLGGDEGWTLVDSSEQSEVAQDALFDFLGRRGVLADGISQIFLTHGHRDHTGLAGQLTRMTGATVLAHESTLPGDPPDVEFLRRHGFSGPESRLTNHSVNGIPREQLRLVREGDVLVAGHRRFRLIATPGHHRGHLCAFDPASGLLLSGDRVLRIPTGVRLHSALDEDPLGDHLRSYDILRALSVRRVLPGHGRSFVDLNAALDEDRRAHEADLRAVLAAVPTRGADPLEIARSAFLEGVIDSERVELAALGRTLAALRLLERQGQVTSDPAADPIRFVR
jgi:glyoxylase-like metal-dependent hydrolase (beta-lactamase superfamily II)